MQAVKGPKIYMRWHSNEILIGQWSLQYKTSHSKTQNQRHLLRCRYQAWNWHMKYEVGTLNMWCVFRLNISLKRTFNDKFIQVTDVHFSSGNQIPDLIIACNSIIMFIKILTLLHSLTKWKSWDICIHGMKKPNGHHCLGRGN